MSSDNFDSAAAPQNCPGPEGPSAGKAAPCAGCPNQNACSSGAAAEAAAREQQTALEVAERLSGVRKFVIVMSGKGGVGKSTVASILARQLACNDLQTGLVDTDLCGPSVATMTGQEGSRVTNAAVGWQPVPVQPNLACASSAFLLPSLSDALVWRGPRKTGLITQLLRDVDWGDLDVLIIDTPPGTSDEHIAVARLLPLERTVAILVSTPQPVAIAAVRKQIEFCQRLGIRIIGLVENMSSYICPCCNHVTEIFPSAGNDSKSLTVESLAKQTGVPLLARVPMDASLGQYCDSGSCPTWLKDDTEEVSGDGGVVEKAFRHLAKSIVSDYK